MHVSALEYQISIVYFVWQDRCSSCSRPVEAVPGELAPNLCAVCGARAFRWDTKIEIARVQAHRSASWAHQLKDSNSQSRVSTVNNQKNQKYEANLS